MVILLESMEFPYEIKVDRRVIIASVIILIIIIVAFLILYKPPVAQCGNGIVEAPEECDRSPCLEGFYCGTECKCVAVAPSPTGYEKKDCSELGGFLCNADEVCKGRILDAKELNCCSIECTPEGEDGEDDVNDGNGGNGGGGAGDEDGGVGGNGENGENDNGGVGNGGSADGDGGIEFCQISSGDIGFECSEERCFGQFEDGCCVGVCVDYDIQGFTECYNLCVAQGIYSEAKCEELCSPY